MSEPVDFFVTDSSPMEGPVDGVFAKVFTPDGRLTVDQGVTDVDGQVGFLLEPGQYQVRFYKQQVKFQNPLLFQVFPAAGENEFDVKAELVTPPTPTDPRLCTAYGFFRTVTGAPAEGVDIHFIAKFKPLLLEGSAILTERAIVRTNENGYVQVNLIRLGQFDVTVQGFEDYNRIISVPDAPNVNLPDLLFPVVASVALDPPGPYVLAEGVDLIVTPTVMATDGGVLNGPATEDVFWSSSDPTVLAVLPCGPTITIRGIAPGSAYILARRADYSIIRYPDPPILGQPVVVQVL